METPDIFIYKQIKLEKTASKTVKIRTEKTADKIAVGHKLTRLHCRWNRENFQVYINLYGGTSTHLNDHKKYIFTHL